ncbi:CPCC family cysteine-rich protein [Peribacillus cavernae]|nr:CPCC family cysteine-rich protein [Peribacillus cavernae]
MDLRYTCSCCGLKTLAESFSYHICKICNWEKILPNSNIQH